VGPGNATWGSFTTATATTTIMAQYNKNVILDEYAGLNRGWNDPDMMVIGMGNVGQTGYVTEVMARSHMAMWCMMNSPIMLGFDLADDARWEANKHIVLNTDVLALNQDPLGIQCKRIYSSLTTTGDPSTEYIQNTNRIDVLANNAGGIFDGPHRTEDGFERTFQVNHLASFLLTHELMDLLLASSAAVVNTSSVAARMFSRLDTDDLECWNSFSPTRAYGDSKLANILHARGVHAHYFHRGVTAMAFHPGTVASNFGSDINGIIRRVYHSSLKVVMTSVVRGGGTLAFFAGGTPGDTWLSDHFYSSNRKLGATNPQAWDDALVEAHWAKSAQLLGLPVG